MKLAIILPAYNEEEAIAGVVEQTLKARKNIINNTAVNSIEIIVVNDGSKDKTADISRKYQDVKLISYADNKGYGYAIKKGFDLTDAELVSFFDVDGTCDPNFLVDLVNLIINSNADIAIGSRLSKNSLMPKSRKISNHILSFLINIFARAKLVDAASGMRVIKREALRKIYPLPDGLNFTPAMSCRAALDKRIKIVEKDMPYYERIGESKLSLVKDGLRFLQVIFDISLTYKPIFFFTALTFILYLISFLYGISLLKFYIQYKMIGDYYHRLSAIFVFILAGTHFLFLGLVLQKAVNIINNFDSTSWLENVMEKILVKRYLLFASVFILTGILMNLKGLVNYLVTGFLGVGVHWLNIIVGGLLILLGIQISSIGLLKKVINLIRDKERFYNKNK